jgi:hypothetical protein
VATLLASADMPIVATAVKICEVLMEKLPDIFDIYFQREGVVHEIEKLATAATVATEKMEIDNNTTDVESFVKTHAQQFKDKYFSRPAVRHLLFVTPNSPRLKSTYPPNSKPSKLPPPNSTHLQTVPLSKKSPEYSVAMTTSPHSNSSPAGS